MRSPGRWGTPCFFRYPGEAQRTFLPLPKYWAKSLGADHVINYRSSMVEDYLALTRNREGYDIVFDTVGGPNIDRVWDLVKENGEVITTTSSEAHDLTPMHRKGLSLHVVFMLLPMLTGRNKKHHQEILRFVAENVDEGRFRPLIDERKFKLSDINEAHAYFESGKHTGKIVISVE